MPRQDWVDIKLASDTGIQDAITSPDFLLHPEHSREAGHLFFKEGEKHFILLIIVIYSEVFSPVY